VRNRTMRNAPAHLPPRTARDAAEPTSRNRVITANERRAKCVEFLTLCFETPGPNTPSHEPNAPGRHDAGNCPRKGGWGVEGLRAVGNTRAPWWRTLRVVGARIRQVQRGWGRSSAAAGWKRRTGAGGIVARSEKGEKKEHSEK